MFRKEQAEAPTPVDLTAGEAGATIDLSGPVTLNLDEVRDEPVAAQWHSVKIERAEPKLTRQKNLPSIFVMSRIIDEADQDFNRTIIWNLLLEGDGVVFTKRCFAALGITGVLEFPSYQAMADALVGMEVEVKLKHRTYKGEVQAQANNWRAVTHDVYM